MSADHDGGEPGAAAPRVPAVTPAGAATVRSGAAMSATEAVSATAAAGVATQVRAPGAAVLDELRGEGAFAALIGTTLAGRYAILRQIGQGGMGAVFEATHTQIGKKVAVKVLLDKYARREAIVARLEQEARLASSIGHEHIIDIIDLGVTDDGRTFVVMELLEGESLAECLAREGRLPEARILAIAAQVASALGAAHAQGIIHRDVKPENLFLVRRDGADFVKVVDFGISKSLRTTDPDGEVSPRLTQTGMVLGTPLYMSPEQARGDEALDHRIDVYALGVIMYECATGRVPFLGANYLAVISQVLADAAPSPRALRPELSEEFDAIVLRAMDKDRDHRYPDAAAMRADLIALLDDPARSTVRAKISPPRRVGAPRSGAKVLLWSAGLAVLLAALAVTVVVLMRDAPPAPAAVAVVVDARPPAPPPDAAPAAQVVEIPIASQPAGATILDGDRVVGTAPVGYPAIATDRAIELVARLDGHADARFTVNPLVDQARTAAAPVVVTMTPLALPPGTKRRPPGAGKRPPDAPPPPGPKPVEVRPPNPAGGGDLGGNPWTNDGTP